MMNRMMKRALVAWLAIFSVCVVSQAQTPAPSPAQEEIPPAKRALLNEYMEVMHIRKNADDILNAVLTQIEHDLPEDLAISINRDQSLTADERQEALSRIHETASRIIERFRLRLGEIRYSQTVERISLSIYNKYFTEDDLRNLITFYKTPVGQKVIDLLPKLFAESASRVSDEVGPKMRQIMDEIVQDEIKLRNDELRWRRAGQRTTPPATTRPSRRRP